MVLTALIKGQKLRIDPHKSGMDIPLDLKGVHIHKSFYEGRRKNKEVLISIKGENIEFRGVYNDKERRSIVNEIKNVLDRDRHKLIDFAKYVADGLYRWSQKNIQIEDAQQYASGIAERLGLKPEASKVLIKKVGDQLVQYVSVHSDRKNQIYTINQRRKRTIIRPGSLI